MDRNGDRQPKFFRDFLQPYWVEFRSLMDKPQLWGYVPGQGWKHNFKTSNHYLSAKHCKTIALMCYRHPQTSDQHFYGFKLGVSQTEKKKITDGFHGPHSDDFWRLPQGFVVLQRNPWGFAGVLRLIPNEPSWSAHWWEWRRRDVFLRFRETIFNEPICKYLQ